MPRISFFYGIAIYMYFNDHAPPHFHAIYAEFEAEFDIRTLDIIAGTLPPRALALVLEWAANHKSELMANWDRASSASGGLERIEPLR